VIHTPSESFEAHDNVASIFAEPDAASITIPDAHLLFTADFKRKGSDLVLTGDDGHKILVADYFRHEKQPDLVSPEGALLSASLVELLAGAAAQQPIGRVETVSGSATVTRNGVAVDLNVGDLVFQGDVVQTRSDSTLGIGFADGSAFSLKENARMALNEFVYDPNSTANSALINLVQGTVSFIAAQVAKTGNMRVDTPTATLGIRGTFVTLSVSSIDGNTVASLGTETDSATGQQFSGAFTLTNRITGNAVNVSSVNSMFSVSPTGTIGESAKPPEVHAIEGQSFQALHAIAAATAAGMGTAPTGPNQFLNDPNSPSGPKGGDPAASGPAPGGSSGANTAPTNTSPVDNQQTATPTTTTTSNTPPANTGPTNIPTNTNQTNTLPVLNQTNTLPDIKPTMVTTDTTKIDTTKTDTTKTDAGPSQPTTNNPTTITTASATGSFSELPNHTNDTTDVDQASGVIAFADPDLSHTHTVTQGAPTFTWSGGSLSSTQKAALTAAGSLQLTTTDSTSSGAGLVAWNYKITDSALDFLAAGEKLTVTYNVTIDDHHGGTVTQPVTVTVTGTNDAPSIVAGSTTATGTITQTKETGNKTASGTIAFKDVDLNDTHAVSQAAPSFVWKAGDTVLTLSAAQQAALAAASTLTLVETDSTHSGTGSVAWTYTVTDASLDFLSAGETLTATYNVTVDDGHGGTVVEPVTVTMTGLTPTLSVTVSGTAQEGLTLTANTTTNDPDAIIHYQWQSSSDGTHWTDICGATGKFYQVTESDETHFIRVNAWTSDSGNSSTASATSDPTAAVTDVAPTLTVPFSYAIDELKIVKTVNGTPTTIYDNTFDQAPPQSPNILSSDGSTPIQFITSGRWTESDDKAIMSATGAVPLVVNDNVSAILNTNSQPQSTSSLGLKENGTFTVSATFNLANPASFTGYGFGLTDGTSTHASDEGAQIVVQKSFGNVVVNLYAADFTQTNPFTLLAS
jgi:VCBS repeat-containing protein